MKEEILDMNPPCVLINGNSFEVLKDMDFRNDKIVVVTDPPFNVGYHYDEYKDKFNFATTEDGCDCKSLT